MAGALRFWLERGVDGFRLDALDRLLKDPELRDDPPATEPFALPLDPDYAELEHTSTRATRPTSASRWRRSARRSATPCWSARSTCPTGELGPYLRGARRRVRVRGDERAAPMPGALRSTIAGRARAPASSAGCSRTTTSRRFASRVRPENARAVALLFLSLPGPVFMLQGDELGMPDGPGVEPPLDRAGRDGFRHPMQLGRLAHGGFTHRRRRGCRRSDPQAAQRRRAAALTATRSSQLFRRLIALRRSSAPRPASSNHRPRRSLVLAAGPHAVAVNLGDEPAEHRPRASSCSRRRPGDGSDLA